MPENGAQFPGVVLRFAGLCGEKNGRLDSLGKGLAEEFAREFHRPGGGKM